MQFASSYIADTVARLDAERGIEALERRRIANERLEERSAELAVAGLAQRAEGRIFRLIRRMRPSERRQNDASRSRRRGIVAP